MWQAPNPQISLKLKLDMQTLHKQGVIHEI